MKIGLIGLPNSGKTTIFNALTRMDAQVTPYSDGKTDPNVAVVTVDDDRLTCLTDMYKPKKTTCATIEMIDFPGMKEGSANNGFFTGNSMGWIKSADALALVVRKFFDGLTGSPTPLHDINEINTELILADLILVENRLEKIEWFKKRGKNTNTLDIEEKALRRAAERLNNNCPVRDIDFTDDEEKLIRGFQFLTKKPFLVILNSDEESFSCNADLIAEIESRYNVIEFSGRFEMELSRLEDEDREAFLEDMGIGKSARERLTQFVYRTLGYLSFFTVGEDEVRAWGIHGGDTAVNAAGAIHTDLARGFIRAECFTYDALMRCGSEKKVRENGYFRLEGKDYIVRDGDILSIRFSV
jgi:GTP-binding protein YchF